MEGLLTRQGRSERGIHASSVLYRMGSIYMYVFGIRIHLKIIRYTWVPQRDEGSGAIKDKRVLSHVSHLYPRRCS